jgi:hypothetical protein
MEGVQRGGCAARWQASGGAPARAFDGDGHDYSGDEGHGGRRGTSSSEVPRTPATAFDGEQESEREGRARLWEGEFRGRGLGFIGRERERGREREPGGRKKQPWLQGH